MKNDFSNLCSKEGWTDRELQIFNFGFVKPNQELVVGPQIHNLKRVMLFILLSYTFRNSGTHT